MASIVANYLLGMKLTAAGRSPAAKYEAHHPETVEGHVLHELPEGGARGVECAVIVEMLGIDIGDNGDVGRQLDEGAVGLVGLDHHPLALADARVRAVGVDDPAVHHRRVEPTRLEQGRDHRGGRGLSMSTGNRQGINIFCNKPKHLSPFQNFKIFIFEELMLLMIFWYCRGINYQCFFPVLKIR